MSTTTTSFSPRTRPRIGLVLGGGALKGFAHIGALRALEEAGIQPKLYAGSSIGALIAAGVAAGVSVNSMAERAMSLRRRDLFRINHVGMLLERMHSPSIYLEAPLRTLVDEIAPDGTFDELSTPLLVTAVDIERGVPIVFGRPGLKNVSIRDAVYASCALPGFFPPGRVDHRSCIDGGTTDNLPVAIAAIGVDALIAVDVGVADITVETGVGATGFASVFMRAATIMMHAQQQNSLEVWTAPPMLLVRPPISHIGWFHFGHTEELIESGYTSMRDALKHLDVVMRAPGGIFPRQRMNIMVDREACIGCAMCVARAPHLMALDDQRKAYPIKQFHDWSPADGDFVRYCPVDAIQVTPAHAEGVHADDLTVRSA
ncbi:MAG: patatin-like phospholipase family protein [Gemmatimonadaceae bacterium]